MKYEIPMTREQLDALEALLANATTEAPEVLEAIKNAIAIAREALELREVLEWFATHGDALDSSGYGSDDKWWECIYNDGKRAGGATPLEAIRAAKEAQDAE